MPEYGKHVNERRFDWCRECGRDTETRYERDVPGNESTEIRWCEDGGHEVTGPRYVTAKPSEATRFD